MSRSSHQERGDLRFHPDELVAIILEGLDQLRRRIEQDVPFLSLLSEETSLHPTSLRLALLGWMDTLVEDQFRALLACATRPVTDLSVTTLAPGNVPVVAAECLILGLLAGVRHTLALSTRATSLAMTLKEVLLALLPTLKERLEVVVWRHLSSDLREQILTRSQKVVVYGTARTIEWIAGLVRPDTALLSHGPSLAVAYLDSTELSADELSTALCGLAHDIALYDQRGCRSPHILFLRGSTESVTRVRDELVSTHLPHIEVELPRGQPTTEELAAIYLDRLTSRSLGEVVMGDGFCLTVERQASVARVSPLGRTLRLIRLESSDQLVPLLRTLPVPVRLVGTCSHCRLPEPLDPWQPEVSILGRLQTPPFNRLHDGRHRLDEYRR